MKQPTRIPPEALFLGRLEDRARRLVRMLNLGAPRSMLVSALAQLMDAAIGWDAPAVLELLGRRLASRARAAAGYCTDLSCTSASDTGGLCPRCAAREEAELEAACAAFEAKDGGPEIEDDG